MTHCGEAEAVAAAQAVRSRQLSQGPLSAELEARLAAFVGSRHAVITPSGSAALLLAMIALGIGPGDEVIVPDITWIATAHGAALLGAKVVLADCLPDLPLLDPVAVARAITPRTRAILPVHLAGRRAPVDPVLDLARPRGIAVVEDVAQALGARHLGRHLGTSGDMGIYSLGITKLVATGQGGFVATDDDALAERLRTAKVHGVRLMPAEDYQGLGINLKFPDILAAVGLVQLGRIEEKMANVRAVYHRYTEGLRNHPSVSVVPSALETGELPLWTEVRCRSRNRLVAHLTARGIETRLPHRPLHHAAHLGANGTDDDFPNASRLGAEMLILPSGPAQPLENVDRVIEAVLAFRED